MTAALTRSARQARIVQLIEAQPVTSQTHLAAMSSRIRAWRALRVRAVVIRIAPGAR